MNLLKNKMVPSVNKLLICFLIVSNFNLYNHMFAFKWLALLKGILSFLFLCCKIQTEKLFREIVSLRDRVKRNYSYVCGLMVMLVKICESRKGLEVFSLRNGLLIILSELLLFAPQVCTTALYRGKFAEIFFEKMLTKYSCL